MSGSHVQMVQAVFASWSNKANVKPCVDTACVSSVLLLSLLLLGIRKYDEKMTRV